MQIPAESRISTAVILNESGSSTRIAYLRQDGRIIGKGYTTENNVEETKQFGNIEEAKDWVHEIAPADAVFSKCSHSNDHFDNIGSNIEVISNVSSLFPIFSISKLLSSTVSSGSKTIFNFVFIKSCFPSKHT